MISAPKSEAMRDALAATRRHFMAAAGFSALVNLLFVVPTIYMLQIYDRVVPTRGLQTLFLLTMVLLFALATLSLLDRVRTRLLVRAAVGLDTIVAPRLLDSTLGRPDLPTARRALRDFDVLRATLDRPRRAGVVRRAVDADLHPRLLPRSSVDRPACARRRR